MSSLREDQVEAAVRFLSNDKVKDRTLEEKQEFLKNKGLTDAEIDEAVRRKNGGSTSASTSTPQPSPPPAPTPVSPTPTPSYQPQQSYPPPPQTTPYGQGYPPQMQPPPYGQPSPYGYNPVPGMAGVPAQGMPGAMYPPMPPPEMHPLYDLSQHSQASAVPRWAVGLGGVAAGLGLTSLLANAFTQRTQQKLIEGNVAMMHQQYGHAHGASHGMLQQPLPYAPPVETTAMNGTTAGSPGVQEDAIKPTAKSIEMEKEKDEKNAKEVYEDLLAILRQNSEESKETSAMFKKCITQQQEQYQTVFTKMQDFLTQQSQQQKPQKSTPTDLSAATLQALASLIEGAKNGDPVERVDIHSTAPAISANGGGMVNSLRESFDAITHHLNRVIYESSSKENAAKALSTLSLVLQNLISNSASEKHRKVNTTGARFASFAKGPNHELMKLAGFEFKEPNFILPNDKSLEDAERVRDLLVSKQRTLDQDWLDRPAVEIGADTSVASTMGVPVDQRRAEEHGEHNKVPGRDQPESGMGNLGVGSGDSMQHFKTVVPAPTSSTSLPESHGQHDSLSPITPAPAVAPPDGGNEGARRPARPWESSVQKSTGPPRAFDSTDKTTQTLSGNTVVEQSAGDHEEDHRFTQPRVQQFAPTTANVTMAHPAESPESSVGPFIAHPAESEDVPQQQPPIQPQQPPTQLQSAVPVAVHPAEVPAITHRAEVPTIAHPAEGSAVSEEPQSGG